ncbi:hypothetical protein ACHWQZ_G013278 [Mnemiopsis leidyi]
MAVNWLPFIGCLSIAFGPSVTLFLCTAAKEAQEALRVVFVLLVKKTDVALSRISRETTDLFHGPRYSVIAGLGYGVMSAMFMYVNVLSEASGPGTYYTPGSPSMPIFVSGALQASVMTGLHVCWGLLCSEGLEKRSWPLLASVTLSHMLVSCLTLMNEAGISPIYAIVCSYLILAVIGTFTFKRFGGNIKPFFKIQ